MKMQSRLGRSDCFLVFLVFQELLQPKQIPFFCFVFFWVLSVFFVVAWWWWRSRESESERGSSRWLTLFFFSCFFSFFFFSFVDQLFFFFFFFFFFFLLLKSTNIHFQRHRFVCLWCCWNNGLNWERREEGGRDRRGRKNKCCSPFWRCLVFLQWLQLERQLVFHLLSLSQSLLFHSLSPFNGFCLKKWEKEGREKERKGCEKSMNKGKHVLFFFFFILKRHFLRLFRFLLVLLLLHSLRSIYFCFDGFFFFEKDSPAISQAHCSVLQRSSFSRWKIDLNERNDLHWHCCCSRCCCCFVLESKRLKQRQETRVLSKRAPREVKNEKTHSSSFFFFFFVVLVSSCGSMRRGKPEKKKRWSEAI